MENNNLNYLSKKDCIKRGFIRLHNGTIYKCNTIEKYALKGFLDGAEYDADELLRAAKRLYKDYYIASIEKIYVANPSKERVDGGNDYSETEERSLAIKRLNSAIKILPKKTFSIVTRVCCEDKDIVVTGTKEQRIRLARHALETLKFGLCRLVKHYMSIEQYKMNKQHRITGEKQCFQEHQTY